MLATTLQSFCLWEALGRTLSRRRGLGSTLWLSLVSSSLARSEECRALHRKVLGYLCHCKLLTGSFQGEWSFEDGVSLFLVYHWLQVQWNECFEEQHSIFLRLWRQRRRTACFDSRSGQIDHLFQYRTLAWTGLWLASGGSPNILVRSEIDAVIEPLELYITHHGQNRIADQYFSNAMCYVRHCVNLLFIWDALLNTDNITILYFSSYKCLPSVHTVDHSWLNFLKGKKVSYLNA